VSIPKRSNYHLYAPVAAEITFPIEERAKRDDSRGLCGWKSRAAIAPGGDQPPVGSSIEPYRETEGYDEERNGNAEKHTTPLGWRSHPCRPCRNIGKKKAGGCRLPALLPTYPVISRKEWLYQSAGQYYNKNLGDHSSFLLIFSSHSSSRFS
jgi:hypothetical protein